MTIFDGAIHLAMEGGFWGLHTHSITLESKHPLSSKTISFSWRGFRKEAEEEEWGLSLTDGRWGNGEVVTVATETFEDAHLWLQTPQR